MQEIVKVRGVLTTYLADEKRTPYAFKRHAIQSSIYGVDIDPGAVDIAKLRLWLSLVVDEEDYESIKPLPNLDYKIVCGNSLLNVEKNLLNYQIFEELEQQKQDYFEETNADRKAKLRATIQKLIKAITNQDETFDFEVYFSEILQRNRGFDVVIGNPPYLGQQGNKEIFQVIKNGKLGRKYHQRRMDLFYFFFHLALDLVKPNGFILLITTNYYLLATYADKLRADIKDRASILKLINFNELKIFESALGQHNIITCLKKGYSEREICQAIVTKREGLGTGEIINSIVEGEDILSEYRSLPQRLLYEGEELFIRLIGTSDSTADYSVHSILTKIESNSVFLGKRFNIFQGLVTGAHKISNSHIKKYNLNNVHEGDGIYVLSLREIASKGLYSNEQELLKSWFKNSDILRWHTKKDSKERVIYLSTKKSYPDIPNIKRHLDKFKVILINRNIRAGQVSLEDYELFIKGKANLSYVMNAAAMKSGNYYCLSYPRDENDFYSPKIVAPQRSRTNTFGYNEIPWFASTDVYFITPFKESKNISLKYVLAILNSRLYYFWFNQKIQRKGEMLELFKTPLSKTPIRLPSSDIQELLIRLVDSILNLSPSEKDEIRNYEVQIDKIIYELYGLTTDEIAVVEGSR